MSILSKISVINNNESVILLCGKESSLNNNYGLSKAEIDYIKNEIKVKEKKHVVINQLGRLVIVQITDHQKEKFAELETLRKAGCSMHAYIADAKLKSVTIVDVDGKEAELLALTEGLVLSNYQFLKYKKNKEKELFSLKNINVFSKTVSASKINELQIITNAVEISRTLVNEPANFLTATQLSKEFRKMGKDAGFEVEVLNKAKITALKMGGLLAVNLGSIDPPTFTIMEYKPAGAKNKKPVVLIGKGVVYDTGGLSLKPTPNSMDMMKCDMAGAAAVAGAMYAVAKAKLPVHVIALVPATDNRPGENAYVPGDVITMYNGLTVEMLNADAEGRMILADALAYAQKYKPELVLDFATLTGAAIAAIGMSGLVVMGNADEKTKDQLKQSGFNTFERLAEMPFWDDYDDLIKSDIADMKNIGGPYAGSITAGKFLARYIDYPWMHFDIAGPAFLTAKDSYRPKGGTGVGVRLLFDYFKNNY
ncbi:MAG: peptidase [Bacteroidetes bacterium]|jgi:leucyl aminopeptidase|nr:peptidase [Bacteroidota bacterium]